MREEEEAKMIFSETMAAGAAKIKEAIAASIEQTANRHLLCISLQIFLICSKWASATATPRFRVSVRPSAENVQHFEGKIAIVLAITLSQTQASA